MAENGSPAPEFETDEDRTYFLIRLPVHAGAIFPVGTKSELSRDQVTREVTTEVPRKYHGSTTEVRLLKVLSGEMTRQQLQVALKLKNDEHFRKAYLVPALKAGLIEMTIPGKPQSSKQKYRLTEKGRKAIPDSGFKTQD